VRVLLDTQCWLWMVGRPDRLSERARTLLRDPGHELLFSAASAWEIVIKHAIGKLELPGDPVDLIPDWIVRSGVIPLPVHHGHALHVARLPLHHADPFDRILIAQARLEDVPVLTADRAFGSYEVELIPA